MTSNCSAWNLQNRVRTFRVVPRFEKVKLTKFVSEIFSRIFLFFMTLKPSHVVKLCLEMLLTVELILFARSSSVHFGSGASSVRLCQGFISHCSIWSEDCSLGNHANAGPGRQTWKNRFVHFCQILVFLQQNGNLDISKFSLCIVIRPNFPNLKFHLFYFVLTGVFYTW